jgi:NitT/TauT family transport system substrate-binding protein
MGKFIIQPHVRLQGWVAEELGFFRDTALDDEFQAGGFSADVEVAVGSHPGSHYSALQALEGFLPRDRIELRFAGTPHEQLGFRKLVDTTFMLGFLLSADADLEDTDGELPADIAQLVDVRRFGPGERIVFEPNTRELYERTQRWLQTWDLFDASLAVHAGFEEAVVV